MAMMSANPKLLADLRLDRALDRWRKAGRRIVFTNGCFDVLHVGHVRYLRAARNLGDVLVIGLNTDASVRALKGEGRPVHALEDRAEVLAALPFVTAIVPFAETSVDRLIRKVRPDVLVKGGDYKVSQVVGHRYVKSYGGEVHVLAHVPGRSSSAIIEKLHRL